jgi:hypothetical protein
LWTIFTIKLIISRKRSEWMNDLKICTWDIGLVLHLVIQKSWKNIFGPFTSKKNQLSPFKVFRDFNKFELLEVLSLALYWLAKVYHQNTPEDSITRKRNRQASFFLSYENFPSMHRVKKNLFILNKITSSLSEVLNVKLLKSL